MNNQKISYKNKAGETVTRYLQQTQSMFKTPWVYNNNFAMPDIEGLDQDDPGRVPTPPIWFTTRR